MLLLKDIKLFSLFYIMILVCFYSCQRTSTEPIDNSDQEPIIVINKPPVISSIVATPDSVQLGKTTTITCNASDPNGDSLSYHWGVAAITSSQTDGSYDFNWDIDAGTITSYGKTAIWQAPLSEGFYVILCKINDIAENDDVSLLEVNVVSTGCLSARTDKFFYNIGDTVKCTIENDTDSTVYFFYNRGDYFPILSIGLKVNDKWDYGGYIIFDEYFDDLLSGEIIVGTLPGMFDHPEDKGTYRFYIPCSNKREYPLSDSLLSNTFFVQKENVK